MDDATSNTQKKHALQAALNGDTQPLQALSRQRGQPYSQQEAEQQRQYLTELSGSPASEADVVTFFGRYDKSSLPGHSCYLLPNGMKLCF